MSDRKASEEPGLKGVPAIIVLGIGPLIGLSTTFETGLFFGLTSLIVALFTAVFSGLLHDFCARRNLPILITLVAAFWISVLNILLSVMYPELVARFGPYLPLLALSSLIHLPILGETEDGTWSAMLQKILKTWGVFLLGLLLLSTVRELLGSGTITLYSSAWASIRFAVPWYSDNAFSLLAYGAGAFVLLGVFLALRARSRDASDERDKR